MAQATACQRRRTRDLHHRTQLRVPGVRAQQPVVTGPLQVVEQQLGERDAPQADLDVDELELDASELTELRAEVASGKACSRH